MSILYRLRKCTTGRGVLCARVWILATASAENVVIGLVFAYRKMSVSQFSVVPVLSQSKTGTTVLSCGNVSEYTFSECTFREGRRCWSRQPDYASIRPTRFLTVGSALSWASVLPFSWVG